LQLLIRLASVTSEGEIIIIIIIIIIIRSGFVYALTENPIGQFLLLNQATGFSARNSVF